jgi:hypothetical protein
MKFSKPSEVDAICQQLRDSDLSRSQNRARINELFNGCPPYSDQEVEENGITVNVNDLSSTRVAHDARSQFYSAFLKPGNYFKARTDLGPGHKRSNYGAIFTREINRPMKRSLEYFECFRSKFASDVLHGIGPATWRDRDCWCPDPAGIDDVLLPGDTLLTMRNLPFFVVYRSFSAPELIRLTRGPNVDPGWKMEVVNSCLEYIDKETSMLMGKQYPDVWSPEKVQERIKSDGGFYSGDQVPTINAFDFYFWNDDNKVSGWNRRMILDTFDVVDGQRVHNSKKGFGRNRFLFNSGNRKYASKREELISFQFADLSAVSPFRYHSVRSLGFLLYAVCHLQNRLRCKFNEAVFEALMMYFRVKSNEESQRALKVNLINKGFIDDTLEFVPASDRFQVNAGLVQLGLQENQSLIEQNSSSYTQNQNFSRDRTEKTKFQVMAEVNAITHLVSAGLTQAYQYQNFEYYEIVRRFCKKNSRDADVRTFRANCLRQGIPEELLVADAWEVEPERIMGAGNKTLEMTIAEQLLNMRNLFDPEPQREILRDVTLAITDDPARANRLVPETPEKVTDSVHDAQLASGSLMQGLPVAVKTGMNHIEYVETLLANMAIVIKKANRQGGMATMDQIIGLQNMAAHIQAHIEIIAQDKEEKARVKAYNDQLSKLMNLVKAFAQRLQEQMEQQAQSNGHDPETAGKVQSMLITAQAKAENTKESHAQRTAQRQLQFEAEEKRKQEQHEADMFRRGTETAQEIQINKSKAEAEAAAPKKESQ